MNTLDYICFGLLAVFFVVGMVRGFAKVVLRLAATVIAGFGARVGAAYAAPYIYGAFVHEKINAKLLSVFPSGSVGGSLESLIASIRDALPAPAYKIAEFLKLLPAAGKFDTLYTVDQLETTYLQPIITKLVLIITTIAAFAVLSVILLLIVNLIDKKVFKKKDSVVSTLNRLVGGLFGLLCGTLPVAAGCALMNVIAPIAGSDGFRALVDQSWLCGFIASIF